jgi:acyl carrier protein
MSDINQRVLNAMAVVFEMDAADIPLNAAPGVLEKWDSLKHMNLVLALEEEFEVRFTDDELVDLLNLKLIVDIVSEKLKGRT